MWTRKKCWHSFNAKRCNRVCWRWIWQYREFIFCRHNLNRKEGSYLKINEKFAKANRPNFIATLSNFLKNPSFNFFLLAQIDIKNRFWVICFANYFWILFFNPVSTFLSILMSLFFRQHLIILIFRTLKTLEQFLVS
jgi:hypothetical protein